MALSFRSNLRIQLLAALLAIPVLVAVIAARQAAIRREAATGQVLAEVQELAAMIQHQEAPILEAARQMLSLLALLPEVRRGDPLTCGPFLAEVRPSFPQWANLGVVDASGLLLCSALPARVGMDLSDRAWFRRAVESGTFAVGGYQIGRITGKPTLNFGLPLLDADGATRGVVFGALDLAWLDQMLGAAALPDGGQVIVTDADGQILVASPPMPDRVGLAASELPAFPEFPRVDDHAGRVVGRDHVERFQAHVRVPPDGGTGSLVVAVAVPADVALAEARAAFGRELGLVAGMLLFSTLLVSVADGWLLRRLQRIVHAARRLAAGDLEARTGLRPVGDPVGDLAKAFDEMAAHVQGETSRLAWEATHDPLTGLPNRKGLRGLIEEALARDTRLALLLVIIDRMHEVVNTLGHPTGDTLLRDVGPRLRAVVGEHAPIGRVGGGEFLVLLSRVEGRPDPMVVARQVAAALARPFGLDGIAVEPGGAVGVVLAPEHGVEPDRLIQRAGVAAVISRRGGLEPALYSPEQDPFSARRLRLIGALRSGVEHGEMTLRFQPKVDLQAGRAAGAEVLVRWHHPELGEIAPTEFVGLAEQTGVIRPLTSWVLGEAMTRSVELRRAGLPVPLSVNISARDLTDPNFAAQVTALLLETGAAPTDLELEVTESALMLDRVLARRTLERLREGGFRVAVDDFGTGYSSLAYLRDLPIQTIKIDARFVRGEGGVLRDPAITRSIIELGHNLGMTVIAEGVHSGRVADDLRALGCDQGQGEWFGCPLELRAFEAWLRTSSWALVEGVG